MSTVRLRDTRLREASYAAQGPSDEGRDPRVLRALSVAADRSGNNGCSVEGCTRLRARCGKAGKVKGPYCAMHRKRIDRYGSPGSPQAHIGRGAVGAWFPADGSRRARGLAVNPHQTVYVEELVRFLDWVGAFKHRPTGKKLEAVGRAAGKVSALNKWTGGDKPITRRQTC